MEVSQRVGFVSRLLVNVFFWLQRQQALCGLCLDADVRLRLQGDSQSSLCSATTGSANPVKRKVGGRKTEAARGVCQTACRLIDDKMLPNQCIGHAASYQPA
ncbi:hypothetical protein EV126DRAFT_428721 [Verticillium dahliae]|nr:hypothetical protein EV126DRAFT_428721 [Verticillium dahliae]